MLKEWTPAQREEHSAKMRKLYYERIKREQMLKEQEVLGPPPPLAIEDENTPEEAPAEEKPEEKPEEALAEEPKEVPEMVPEADTSVTEDVVEDGAPVQSQDSFVKVMAEMRQETDAKIDKLANVVAFLAETVQKAQEKAQVTEQAPQPKKPTRVVEEVDFTAGPPKSWRAIIDRILGFDFEARVSESSGGNYNLMVIVPKPFDRRVGDERAMSPYDHSSFLIRRSSDLADVELWCKRMKDTIVKIHPEFDSLTKKA